MRRTIGEVIVEQRTFLGMSRTDLAEMAQVSASTLGNIERGESTDPSYETVLSLLRQLDMTVEDLEEWRRV